LQNPTELARALWAQHRDRVRFESLGSSLPSIESAYDVQDELVRLMMPTEGAPRGYKIGLTSLRMQQMCGIDQPVAGRILERRVHGGAARIAAASFARLGVESELCLILKEDLPARRSAYTLEDIANAVDGAAAAFELIDDRGADYHAIDARTLVADNSWNAGVVLAESSSLGNARIDVGALEGVLTIDDRPVDRGNSRDALTHPFAVVLWLANHLRGRGSCLRAGDLVMTGSIVPTRFAKPGEHYRFELEGLAAAELRVT